MDKEYCPVCKDELIKDDDIYICTCCDYIEGIYCSVCNNKLVDGECTICNCD